LRDFQEYSVLATNGKNADLSKDMDQFGSPPGRLFWFTFFKIKIATLFFGMEHQNFLAQLRKFNQVSPNFSEVQWSV
jgi:hypothetical protein